MAKVKIKPNQKAEYSNEYYCIHSIQKLNSKFDTNVLTSNIPIRQLLKNRDILLVDDLKGDERWGMNKIIQRNISEKRVDEIKNEYLETSNRSIKFFPAITVILLPKSKGEPVSQFNLCTSNFDDICGISVEKTYEEKEFLMDHPVVLQWDKNQISALVIDGQHRVSAIRKFYEDKNENKYHNVSIPVTYVIFKNDPAINLIHATRALFIDVNNTPRLVSEEKLIFIDDRNIHRRITAKAFGANDPDDDTPDAYQRMLNSDELQVANKTFINRYFIEESGKDDEERRGFLSNHSTLFPWEFSNIMTIHNNILGGILLSYEDIDKSRDIRSICYQLNNTILKEIEEAQTLDQLEISENYLLERLTKAGLSEAETAVFKNLLNIKKKTLGEIQAAEGQFYTGTMADPSEEEDRKYFLGLLQNIYNQDCTKDIAFELSALTVTDLLGGKSEVYIKLLTQIFNELWFIKNIKKSIESQRKVDKELIFNFILFTHESVKINNGDRRKINRISKQINDFLKEITADKSVKKNLLQSWAEELEKNQEPVLLRTVVGQEMLFLYILSTTAKLSSVNIGDIITEINALGEIGFFNKNENLSLVFFNEDDLRIENFNQWSEIILKGDRMKPGITNAIKGSYVIKLFKEKITNRKNAGGNLRILDRVQKSYGKEIIKILSERDSKNVYKMYKKAKKSTELEKFLTQNEIDIISEDFTEKEELPIKVINVIGKLFGAYAHVQIADHFNSKISV